MVQRIDPSILAPKYHMKGLVPVPAPLLPIQLLVDASRNAVGDAPNTRAPATQVRLSCWVHPSPHTDIGTFLCYPTNKSAPPVPLSPALFSPPPSLLILFFLHLLLLSLAFYSAFQSNQFTKIKQCVVHERSYSICNNKNVEPTQACIKLMAG